MAKAYIEMKFRQRRYKLIAEDIAKVYKINKRKTPVLPSFD
jgi:predicted alternative tryptophan synthase beta-subunit